jgi:hypothetical protein
MRLDVAAGLLVRGILMVVEKKREVGVVMTNRPKYMYAMEWRD